MLVILFSAIALFFVYRETGLVTVLFFAFLFMMIVGNAMNVDELKEKLYNFTRRLVR